MGTKLTRMVAVRMMLTLFLVAVSLTFHAHHPPNNPQEPFSPSVMLRRPSRSEQAPHTLIPSGLSPNFYGESPSLVAALSTLVTRELAHCRLVVAADHDYFASTVVHSLALLPNQKQVCENS